MLIRKLLLLSAMLLFATSSRAQSQRSAAPAADNSEYKEVKVSVILPKAVNVVRNYGKILLGRNDNTSKIDKLTQQLQSKTTKPVVDVTIAVPKNWVTRKLGLVD